MTAGIGRMGARSACLALASGIALAAGGAQAQLKHDGVEATVMTFTGPQIAEPLQRRAPDFKQLTGATDQRRHGAVFRSLQQAAHRLRHRHEQHRRHGVRAAVDGRLHRARLSRGPDRARQRRRRPAVGRRRAVLPRLQRHLQRQDLHHPARWRLPDGLLPQRSSGKGRPAAAQDLGRLHRDRQDLPRPGPERRRQGRLRLLHRQEAQRPVVLDDHLGGRRLPAVPGHRLRARSSTPTT